MKIKNLVLLCVFLFVSNFCLHGQNYDLNNGLVAHYKFNSNLSDESRNNYVGKNKGVIYDYDLFEKEESALSFKSYLQVISLPHEILNQKENFSISVWIKTLSNDVGILSGAYEKENACLIFIKEKRIQLHFLNEAFSGKKQIADNEWHHILITRDFTNSELKLFIDGKLDMNVKVKKQPLIISKNGLHIGNEQDCPGGCWDSTQQYVGKVDELRFYDRYLSECEIKALATNSESIKSLNCNQLLTMDTKYYKNNEGNFIDVPLGKLAFADSVYSFNCGNSKVHKLSSAKSCLGEPDYISPEEYSKFVSLGCKGGELIIEFIDNALIDVPGIDLYIFEVGWVEPCRIEISKNSFEWIDIGKVTGGTIALDIKEYIKPNEKYYFVKIIDLGSPDSKECSQEGNSGVDIDAIAAIGASDNEKVSQTNPLEFDSNGDSIVLKNRKVKVKVWDNAKEDGDLVDIYLNGKMLYENQEVLNKGFEFEIYLDRIDNKFELRAKNEGRINPNTAAILVYDGRNKHQIILSSKEGESKSIKLVME